MHSGKRDPDLLKTSLVGPSWMQTTKKFYTKENLGGAKKIFKGKSSKHQNPREESKRAIFVDVKQPEKSVFSISQARHNFTTKN